jgi:glycine/D-amino acid oxidase-like deaminating enzyme
MFSYWERESFSHYNHIVIGAGIVGLNAAVELKELYPQQSVLVLERGLLPTGASTRNAGFACMGSVTELLDDLTHMSEAEMVSLYEWRKTGLEKMRKRLGKANIGYRENGSYELLNEQELPALDKIDYLNDLLQPIIGRQAFSIANERIEPSGFSATYTKALIQNNCEGEINTGRMMRALVTYALQKGIEIKTGADVTSFSEEEKKVSIHVQDPFRKETWQLQCDTLTICTNAFTKQLLPKEDVTPGRGQVLVTKPITGLKFKGIYHFDKGYYYFREIDGRVLLGGGRNLDFEGEATISFDLSILIQNDLIQKLYDIILPSTPFEIDMQWSGIMAFGHSKQPIIKAFSNRVFGAFRMGGMGVALAAEAASKLASLHRDFRGLEEAK